MSDKKKIDIYIVAGEASVGKSEAIRYIAGKTRKQRYNYETLVTTTDEDLNVFFRTQSLQEAEIEVANCISELNIKREVSAIIIALRTDSYKGFPIAEKYIDFYAKHGYNIKFVAELFAKIQNSSRQTPLEAYCKNKGYKHKKFPFEQNVNVKCQKVKQFFGFK